MRNVILIAVAALAGAGAAQGPARTSSADEILSMERAALDRWGKGDPRGYLEIYAPEVTYFDPGQDARVDGLESMKALLLPLTGKIKIDRYAIQNPKVQPHGDVAILSYNIVNYQKQADGSERIATRWNVTEAYGRVDGRWRIIHSHFSYVKPEPKRPVSEGS